MVANTPRNNEHITIYSSPSVIRTIWGTGGPNYPRIRSNEGKHRGIGTIKNDTWVLSKTP
jgi:hypothetical protein